MGTQTNNLGEKRSTLGDPNSHTNGKRTLTGHCQAHAREGKACQYQEALEKNLRQGFESFNCGETYWYVVCMWCAGRSGLPTPDDCYSMLGISQTWASPSKYIWVVDYLRCPVAVNKFTAQLAT